MAWSLGAVGGLTLARCEALSALEGIVHAFSTRGTSGPTAAELLAAAGLGSHPAVMPRQVHGARVLRLGPAAPAAGEEADAIVAHRADRPVGVPIVRTADCLPILLADSGSAAVATVHAGWRGTAAGVVRKAVDELRRMGIPAERLVAAIGPGIGPCCYEVGPEVESAAAAALTGAHPPLAAGRHLDLALANRLQLREAGVRDRAIHAAPWCTACRPDLFHSYRRDGPGAGRALACIGWPAP